MICATLLGRDETWLLFFGGSANKHDIYQATTMFDKRKEFCDEAPLDPQPRSVLDWGSSGSGLCLHRMCIKGPGIVIMLIY